MFRLLVVVLLLGAALAGCGPARTGGFALPARTTGAPPTTTTSAPATLNVDLCSLLTWTDLNYPGAGGPGKPPSSTGHPPGFSQFCQWTAWEYTAGYTPPPVPDCDNGGSAVGAAQCAADAAAVLAQITAHTIYVNVGIGWRPDIIEFDSTSDYTQDGHDVAVEDISKTSTCVTALRWAHGTLEVEVEDSSRAFGTPCAQATRFTNLLISREPR